MKIIDSDSLMLIFEERIKFMEITFQTLDKNGRGINTNFSTKLGKKTLKKELNENNETIPQYIIDFIKFKHSDLEDKNIQLMLLHYVYHQSFKKNFLIVLLLVAIVLIILGGIQFFDPYMFGILGVLVLIANVILDLFDNDRKKRTNPVLKMDYKIRVTIKLNKFLIARSFERY